MVALISGVVLSLCLGEILLRIYNPFPAVVKSNRIVLRTHARTIYEQTTTRKLQHKIQVTSNELGFRGDPLPEDPESFVKMITVGGSTTHCLFNSDGLTWPCRLENKLKSDFQNIWINNAGLSGHSTYGHTLLIQDIIVKLKPEVVIFLVGRNDMARESPDEFSLVDDRGNNRFIVKAKEVLFQSELLGVLINLTRVVRARKADLGHHIEFKLEEQGVAASDPEKEANELMRHETYLKGYRHRLSQIIRICRENGIQPVFLTQPALFGDQQDPTTGLNLVTIKAGKFNGSFSWKLLEKYNDVTRQVCRENGVFLIETARLMPKDSQYYFDLMHYSDAGCEKFAEIIHPAIKEYLSRSLVLRSPHAPVHR